MKYSIDTSALLDGWRRYPRDHFESLWTNIERLIEEGKLAASIEVLGEIQRKDDDLYRWAREFKTMFVPIDREVQLAVTAILRTHQRLVDTVKGRSTVDPWVIALAHVHQCAVVTHERLSTKSGIVRIPDVCASMGIRTMTLLEMIKDEQWKF